MPKDHTPPFDLDPGRTIYSASRFRDKVSVFVADNGGVVYLDAAEARQLGRYLIDAAATIDSPKLVSPAPLVVTAKDRML